MSCQRCAPLKALQHLRSLHLVRIDVCDLPETGIGHLSATSAADVDPLGLHADEKALPNLRSLHLVRMAPFGIPLQPELPGSHPPKCCTPL